ncbi:MAG: hypothetical protein NTU69_10125 [Proteobacteria bacterium]|nr:hypothetical protein [Pseudomonadota bacterium]
MFNKGFEIGTLDLPQLCLTRLPIKVEEERDGCEGAIDGPRLVVCTPLVPQIVLEVLLFGEFQLRKPHEDAVDGGSCMMVVLCCFESVTVWSVLYYICLGHFLPPFLWRKSRLDNDP